MRTNYFQNEQKGDKIIFKFDTSNLALAPEPRPYREIFVFSRRFEGVHLRGGPVARGGLRWSDRMEDYRTEVLGLVKAQMVKNAVIVPAGSKGGFVCKQMPKDAVRETIAAEGEAVYRLFISSLLEVTDNRVRGAIVPPSDTVRYDQDDPYLVVAADKGTATFSDIANSIAVKRGFWLGDAFASGGSNGYDHKKMGITAKGAFEAVKRHFYEMDHDMEHHPDHHGRRGRHVGRRVRQRRAAVAPAESAGRVRPPPHLPRPDAGRRDLVRRARSACSRCHARRGKTTTRN